MPRAAPLTRKAVEINIAPLSAMEQREIAKTLGLDALPDYLASFLACLIASHHTARQLAKGHTPAKVAAGLRRIESRLHRDHDGHEMTREIADPHFGIDGETWTRLAPIVANPNVPLNSKLAEIEARRSEVEVLPRINPLYALRVVLAAEALEQIWDRYAVRRDDRARQWEFILAVLEAAGEGTEGFYRNSERLRGDLRLVLERTSRL
jgi:hypothetical protein